MAMPHTDPHSIRRTSELLASVASEAEGPSITLADFADHLRERSFGLLLLILAIIGWIPILPPGVASIFGLAILLLAGQMVLGRVQPWLPHWIARRAITSDAFARLVTRITPALQRLERVARPRLPFLTCAKAERLVAGFVMLLALVICVPLPMTNAFPALAVAILAIALIQQDGLLTLLGILAGVAALGIMVAFWSGAFFGLRWAAG
jgi:hypothetical protein